MSSSPAMRVRGRPRTVQEWLGQYVVPMAELTTLATARGQRAAWMQVGHGPDGAGVQVFGTAIEEQASYDATEPRPGADDQRPVREPDPAGSRRRRPGRRAGPPRWRDLRAGYGAFGDYLVLPRTDPLAGDRARLLAGVPALEALRGPPPPGRDEQRRNEVLDHVHAVLRHAGHRAR